MDNKPSISIITPVWNGMPFIQECVESVIMQDFQDWEMLIGDNCSDDDTHEYLNSLTDSRIRVFKHDKNKGIYGNLNYLFTHAKSSISQILCADDYFINHQALSVLVNYWETASYEIGFAAFNQNGIPQCRLTRLQKEILPTVIDPSAGEPLFFLFGNIPGNLSNVSLRTNLVTEGEGFREDLPYAGDFEFWSRAARNVPMAIRDETIIYVRRHPNVASNYLNRKGELLPQTAFIIDRLYDNLIKQFPDKNFVWRLHATLNYDSQQRYIALKLALKGKLFYLTELEKVAKKANYVSSWLLRWFLFFLTFGGKLGRRSTAKYLLRKSNIITPNLSEAKAL